MDPLSIGASTLSVITATIASVHALYETVKRYKSRDKVLSRLEGGLMDLVTILNSLEVAANDETPMLTLLKGPVDRCAQVCHEFEGAMKVFSGKSKTSFRDWTKMEFMRGDINEFIDTLADYKSTITIGLGTIAMQNSKLTQQVVEGYSEIIKDTAYSLEIRLQRINEKITSLATDRPILLEDLSIDLRDEKAVTVQCLHICERASSYISLLQHKQPALKGAAPQQSAGYVSKQFEAQLLTQNSLQGSRDTLLDTIRLLRKRLDSMNSHTTPDDGTETLRLQEEINFSKQCLEVCEQASNQVSNQKIHIVGDVIAEGDCDQVVVTTLADLFNVGTVKASGRSAQLVGSMEADVLRQVSNDRYRSRFGAAGGSLDTVQVDTTAASLSSPETRKASRSPVESNQAKEDGRLANKGTTYDRPSPNEVRRRTPGSEDGSKKTG